MSLSISHSIDADDIAFAMAGLDSDDLEKFASELLVELDTQDERAVDIFADAVAKARKRLAE